MNLTELFLLQGERRDRKAAYLAVPNGRTKVCAKHLFQEPDHRNTSQKFASYFRGYSFRDLGAQQRRSPSIPLVAREASQNPPHWCRGDQLSPMDHEFGCLIGEHFTDQGVTADLLGFARTSSDTSEPDLKVC